MRHLLPQSPHWKAVADESIPISAADILVTFHSLGTYVHQKLLEWKIPYPAADQEAFLHMWQVAVHLLGVPYEHIPKTWAEAVAPIIGTFKSMDGYAEVTDEVAGIPADSVWSATSTGPLRS